MGLWGIRHETRERARCGVQGTSGGGGREGGRGPRVGKRGRGGHIAVRVRVWRADDRRHAILCTSPLLPRPAGEAIKGHPLTMFRALCSARARKGPAAQSRGGASAGMLPTSSSISRSSIQFFRVSARILRYHTAWPGRRGAGRCGSRRGGSQRGWRGGMYGHKQVLPWSPGTRRAPCEPHT